MTVALRAARVYPGTWLVWLAGAVCLLVVYAAYLAFDIWAAVSLQPAAVALACVASLPGSVLLGYRRTGVVRLALPTIVIATLLLVPFIDWDTRKPFLRAFNAVEVGMTVAEVDRAMASYIRRPAITGTVSNEGMVAFGHTTAGWGDSDAGIVYFVDGRVVRSHFLPD